MTQVCPTCNESFHNKEAVMTHRAQAHEVPWQDKELLEELYHEEHLSMKKIAEELGCSDQAIYKQMKKHGIKSRTRSKSARLRHAKNPAGYGWSTKGYEYWTVKNIDKFHRVYVHRLLAVAKYGFDEVTDKVVHHKNGVRWDNRPGNIELMESNSEHTKHHWENGDFDNNWKKRRLNG